MSDIFDQISETRTDKKQDIFDQVEADIFDQVEAEQPSFSAPDDPRAEMLDAGPVESETENNVIPWTKQALKGVAHAVTSTAPSMVNAAGRQFVDRARSLDDAGPATLLDSDYEAETPEYTQNFLKNLSEKLGVGAEVWKASGRRLEPAQNATEGEKRAFGVGESLGLVAAAVPFGATGGPVALGIGTSGQKYQELVEAGVDPERAHRAALVSGVAETVPELFSFRIGLSKKIPFLKKLVYGQVSEILGESATSATQLGSDIWAMNPGATKEQIAGKYANEIGDTLQETVIQTLIQSPIQSAGMHAVTKLSDLKVKTNETISRIQQKLGIGQPAQATATPLTATQPVGSTAAGATVQGMEQAVAQNIDIEGDINGKSTLQMRENAQTWAAELPGLSQQVYERLSQLSPADLGATEKEQLQELRTRISESGETTAEAMRALWEPDFSNAPRRLQQAFADNVVMPQVPYTTTQKTTEKGENLTRGTSISPLDIAREHVLKGNEQEGLTDESVARIAKNIAFDAGMPSFFRKEYIRPYAEKAVKHVQETGEEISRTHLDIGNLTGVNLSKGHEAANKHIQDISEIIKQSYEEIIPADQLDFGREGGDEMSVYGRGVSKSDLDRAAQSAKIKVEQYAKDNGLLQLPTKTKGVLKDVTLHINTASISEFLKNNPKATTQDFLTYNDAKLAKEAENVTRRKTKETRTIASEGQSAGVVGGLRPDNQQIRAETPTAAEPPAEVTPQPSQQTAQVTPEISKSTERSEKREAQKVSREERIARAKEQRGSKQAWEVPVAIYADSTGYLGGSARKLIEGDHRSAVEKALSEGKPVPEKVLKEYGLKPHWSEERLKKVALPQKESSNLPVEMSPSTSEKTKEKPQSDEKNVQSTGGKTESTKADTAQTSLEEAAEKTSKTLNDFIDTTPKAGLAVQDISKIKQSDDNINIPGGNLESVNKDVEFRWRNSRGLAKKTFIDRLKEHVSHVWEQRKHFPGLDYESDAKIINILREYEATPEYSKHVAAETTAGILAGLGPKKYDVFTRNVILPDILKDIESGILPEDRLPFGYKNRGEVESDRARFKAVAEANPDIKAALERRQGFNDALRKELVDKGLLPKEVLKDDRYFHHQVLEYMDAKRAGTSSKDVRTHNKGWQKGRKGSSLDYNTEYVEAEWEYTAQAFAQLKTVEILDRIKSTADISEQVKAEAKARGLDDFRKAIPEGYTTWQPKPGTTFYKAVSIPQRLIDDLLSGQEHLKGMEGVTISAEDLKTIMAVGGQREQWVIPENVAKTLDNFRDFGKDEGFDRFVRSSMATWKQWTLLNPLRVLKYNINNMSGDLDIALAYDPRILKYFKEAAGEAWGHYKGQAMSRDMKAALENGVIGSGFTLQEIPDVKDIGLFSVLMGDKQGVIDLYWGKTKGLTQARENILRLAAFKYFRDRTLLGKKVYGASRPELVDAEKNPTKKAALLARDLVGDYGNVSAAGNWLRERMIPFFSWMEINAPRYVRMMQNLAREERAGSSAGRLGVVAAAKTAKSTATFAVKAATLVGLVMLWNEAAKRMLDIDDDEKRALYEGRNQLHLILGRREDGTIMSLRIQGALSDALDWFGMGDPVGVAKDFAAGKQTATGQLAESAKAPINRIINASHPILKTGAEILTGKQLYPDAFKPKPIRDKAEHAARLLTLDMPYRYITGKPTKGIAKDILGAIVYSNDPGEAAYWNTRKQVYDFLESKGQEVGGYAPTERSNAMYYYKQAKRFGDEKAAEKYLKKYIDLGGTIKGFGQSINRSAPLASLPKKYQDEFLESQNNEGRRDAEIADKWYEKHMVATEQDYDLLNKFISEQ